MKDNRDPQVLGGMLLDWARHVRSAYGEGIPLAHIYDLQVAALPCVDYDGSGFMSANPTEHHMYGKVVWEHGSVTGFPPDSENGAA